MTKQQGGCLCGALRFEVTDAPLRVTVCYCHFCQRATGSHHLVEPIFEQDQFQVTSGAASVYTLPSSGSGKDVHVHFCNACGTKVALTFDRWPAMLGVYAGTFDRPGWFDMTPDNTKHIFVSEAAPGTIIPAGFPIFHRHAIENDDTEIAPEIYDAPRVIGD